MLLYCVLCHLWLTFQLSHSTRLNLCIFNSKTVKTLSQDSSESIILVKLISLVTDVWLAPSTTKRDRRVISVCLYLKISDSTSENLRTQRREINKLNKSENQTHLLRISSHLFLPNPIKNLEKQVLKTSSLTLHHRLLSIRKSHGQLRGN